MPTKHKVFIQRHLSCAYICYNENAYSRSIEAPDGAPNAATVATFQILTPIITLNCSPWRLPEAAVTQGRSPMKYDIGTVLLVPKLFLYLSLFASQQGVSSEGWTSGGIPSDRYQLTPEELQAFRSIRQEAISSSTGTSIGKIATTHPAELQCEKLHSGIEPETGIQWHRSFFHARCDPTKFDKRLYFLTCHSLYKAPPDYAREYHTGDEGWDHYCPENTICQDIFRINPEGEGPRETIACVDESEVRIEEVSAADAVHTVSGTPNLHCGHPASLPGTYYSALSKQPLDLILTEEVFWPNGSAYNAPVLLIHDRSSPLKFDRAFRTNAHVASAQIVLNSIAGKLESKTIDFCMRLWEGERRTEWVIFMYSWFKVVGRSGIGVLRSSIYPSGLEMR